MKHAQEPADVAKSAAMRFRAITDADPRALSCVLERLRARNIVPTSLSTAQIGQILMEIKIELAGLSRESFEQIVDDIDKIPGVISAVPFNVDWTHAPASA